MTARVYSFTRPLLKSRTSIVCQDGNQMINSMSFAGNNISIRNPLQVARSSLFMIHAVKTDDGGSSELLCIWGLSACSWHKLFSLKRKHRKDTKISRIFEISFTSKLSKFCEGQNELFYLRILSIKTLLTPTSAQFNSLCVLSIT